MRWSRLAVLMVHVQLEEWSSGGDGGWEFVAGER